MYNLVGRDIGRSGIYKTIPALLSERVFYYFTKQDQKRNRKSFLFQFSFLESTN